MDGRILLKNYLKAGTWEECCFRAVPLSIAAIVGRRYKRERLFIMAMMLVQAVIFGAAHANYPSMPSWARSNYLTGATYVKLTALITDW